MHTLATYVAMDTWYGSTVGIAIAFLHHMTDDERAKLTDGDRE